MKLQTSLKLVAQNISDQIDYQSNILLIGSCFATNIANKLLHYQFKHSHNPLGIFFNPLSILNFFEKLESGFEYKTEDIFFHQERWHCFDAHSSFSNADKYPLLEKLNNALVESKSELKSISHLVISLGTAWTYYNKHEQICVSNCHKLPQNLFEKRLLNVSEIETICNAIVAAIQRINAKTKIIFTVSPVRHLKDGIIENSRSKAHLISAIHAVNNQQQQCFYFPSYELMMDEMRDYRFYSTDLLHPNDLAVEYIWEKFSKVWIKAKDKKVMDKVAQVQSAIMHRPFNPKSKAYAEFKVKTQISISELLSSYPFMHFEF